MYGGGSRGSGAGMQQLLVATTAGEVWQLAQVPWQQVALLQAVERVAGKHPATRPLAGQDHVCYRRPRPLEDAAADPSQAAHAGAAGNGATVIDGNLIGQILHLPSAMQLDIMAAARQGLLSTSGLGRDSISDHAGLSFGGAQHDVLEGFGDILVLQDLISGTWVNPCA